MKLEDVIAALKPFADFTSVIDRGFNNIPRRGEPLITQTYSVNGEAHTTTISVEDLYAAKAAHDFLVGRLNGDEPKNPAPTPEEIASATKLGDKTDAKVSKGDEQKPDPEADVSKTMETKPSADEAKAEIAAAKKGK